MLHDAFVVELHMHTTLLFNGLRTHVHDLRGRGVGRGGVQMSRTSVVFRSILNSSRSTTFEKSSLLSAVSTRGRNATNLSLQ